VAKSEKRSSRPAMRRVLLLIETSSAFGRRVLRGVSEHLRSHEPWSVTCGQRDILDRPPDWLEDWDGNGVISRVPDPKMAEWSRRRGIPVVDLSEMLMELDLPRVSNDHLEFGRMGAAHLLGRGFRQFAYVGQPGLYWSDRRYHGFAAAAVAAGGVCQQYTCAKAAASALQRGTWELEMNSLQRWLADLPKPVGLMAANDFHALLVIEACHRIGVAVPEQMAVLGVTDEDVVRDLVRPSLSTIMDDGRRMGREAAAVLETLMRGEPTRDAEILIPPIGIIVRESTDILSISDPVVARAVQFIRDNFRGGIKVADVVRHVLVSQSVLQQRFRKALNQTVHEMIVSLRVQHVEQLLFETDFPLARIAAIVGFEHVQHMSEVFTRVTGRRPGRYRQENGYRIQKPFQVRSLNFRSDSPAQS
jgi:LacI family transcriptional regulator